MGSLLRVMAAGVLLVAAQLPAWAVSDTLDVVSGEVIATEQWNSGNFSITYDVTQAGDVFSYQYTLCVPEKAISHFILAICPNLTLDADNTGDFGPNEFQVILPDGWSTSDIVYGTFGPGPGNPGMPNSITGIKFDNTVGTNCLNLTILTHTVPTDGSFYAKDGKTGGNDLYAYNTGLNGGNAFILVPSCQIPEPTGFVLAAMGIVGAGLILRRRS